ncbi:MAG: glycoside hydrolase family 2 protein, partial [Anaerolineae bacterium]|nr:glycoside hydrolase family 2 protein [Anaerolineae bacterium]
MFIQSLSGNWQFRQAGDEAWLPAVVPGGVHTDLMAAGRIPDPFVGDNEKYVQWVAESDWEYRRTAVVGSKLLAEDRVFLVCDGLDTLATVSVNGWVLGQTDNMFRQYRWEVKEHLVEGENEIVIAFASPVKYVIPQMDARPMPGVSQAIPGGPYLRKAPCQFGWDWGPMLPPIGIWKDIRLEGRSTARIDDVHLRQQHQNGQVTVSAQVTVECWDQAGLAVVLRITAPNGDVFENAMSLSCGDTCKLEVTISDPKWWWPNGYGDQPLYQVQVVLQAAGTTVDQKCFQFGLRTLELRREPDQWGESFTFVVNGVPVFAKGSNWIPADSFPTRLTDQFMEHLIWSAAEANQNMLRVWGGGLYEEERFYDLCDRYGVLVWQDFIYSCSIYPMGDAAFLDNARIEAEENIKRLRHRASLALWCGNNEMEWGWYGWGWDRPEHKDLKEAYDRFFHRLLPAWIDEFDPDTPYWPSSPSSNIPFDDPGSQLRGDAHYWDVWHGRRPFTAYRGQYPRFMSEFGFQSLPPLRTVATYAEEKDRNMTSYIMEHHQRSGSGNGLMIAQMTDTFRMPKDFASLVYLSLILQAEGIRYGVEHWRRAMARVSGTLIWQLNDCWPVASWASIDYFGRWKALHYAAKRFYAPLLLSVEDNGVSMGVHVTSDLTEGWQGMVRWSLETLGGEVLEAGEEAVAAKPLAD